MTQDSVQSDGMTRREREDLMKHVRKRERVEKTRAAQRKSELRAEFEAQLASIYTPDDDAMFRELHKHAEQEVERADAALAERCRELGIPERFRPKLNLWWQSRGENALASRRAELRKVAETRLDAIEKAAKARIEEQSLAVQEQLLVGGLATDVARGFLDALPTVRQLMPVVTLDEVKQLTAQNRQASRDAEKAYYMSISS